MAKANKLMMANRNKALMTAAAAARFALLAGAAMALSSCGVVKGNKGGPKTPVVGKRTSILTSESGVELDPSLADVPVSLPPADVNSEWSQPGGGPSKYMGQLALGPAPRQLWSTAIRGGNPRARLAASPVVAGGKLYVIDTEARVTAFNADTGARLWQMEVAEGGNGAARFGGGVSVSGDRVFATNGVGEVAALSAADGKILWKVHPGGPLRGSPTLSNGHVYVMSQDNQLLALSQDDGSTAWTVSGTLQTTGVFGVAAPAAGQGTVIAGYSSGEITAYRYENGRDLWGDALSRTSISTSVATLTDIDADPVIDRGRVFAIGQGGRMASYELVSGQRLWELNIAGISTPWVAGDWLFVVTDDAKLLCVARATGKIRWISQLKRYRVEKSKKDPMRWTGPVLAGGRLVLVSNNGNLVYADPATGKVQSDEKVKGGMTLTPVVANNTLYILSDDGRLTAYR